jgi:hypothetical protein
MPYNYPKVKEPMKLQLGADTPNQLDGGLNLAYTESGISLSQSPHCINVNGDDKGTISSRKGQAYIYPTSLGIGVIQGLYPNYQGFTIFAHNSIIYKQQGSSQPLEIYRFTQSVPFVNFFIFNSLLYFTHGTGYKVYNGTTISDVVAYIPTITFNRSPKGTNSQAKENLNMLTGSYKDSFSANGEDKTFVLTGANLDSIDKVWINGAEVTTGFTKDLINGAITFTTAPQTGVPNNVLIQSTRGVLKDAAPIYNCTKSIEFSSRVWLTGNSQFQNRLWKSGLTDDSKANYFPSLGSSIIGNGDDSITGFVNHYDKLIIFKEHSIFYTMPESQSDGSIAFPYKLINDEVGCDMPNSIQLINNVPVFANTENGVFVIQSTLIPGERNVQCISENINGTTDRQGLLGYSADDLKKATSYDFQEHYYLCINRECYVLDYSSVFNPSKPNNLHWYYYTNINALYWFNRDRVLCYADKSQGQLVKFIDASNDFGLPILNLWQSKLLDFDVFDHYKTIKDLWIVTSPNAISSINIKYYNEKGELKTSTKITTTKSYGWTAFNWLAFSWSVFRFPPTTHVKLKLKDISYFQLEFSSNKVNESLSIINVAIHYILGKKKR